MNHDTNPTGGPVTGGRTIAVVLAALLLLIAGCSSGTDDRPAGSASRSLAGSSAATDTAGDPDAGASTEAATGDEGPADDAVVASDDDAGADEAGTGDAADDEATDQSDGGEEAAPAPSIDGGDYLQTFDDPDSMSTLDFYVANGRSFHDRPASWEAEHAPGETCGGPDTTRTISWPDPPGNDTPTRTTDPGETAYWCAPGGEGTGHMMTAFFTRGYAHLDFSPKQTFTDVKRVCWDINATNLGNRKWHQLVIVDQALADSVAPRLDWTHPSFRDRGPASWGLELTDGVFMFTSLQGGAEILIGGQPGVKGGLKDLSVSDQKKRVTTCLTDLGTGEIEVSQERWSGQVDITMLAGSFPTGDVRVVFQDTSYNPAKALDESPPERVSYTWHWDNLLVSSSIDR